MHPMSSFLAEHQRYTRRFFLGAKLVAASLPAWLTTSAGAGEEVPDALREVVNTLESFLTDPADFRDVSRGKPIPHTLSEPRKKAAGLTRETWRMEVLSDPEHPARIENPLTLNFDRLLQLGETHAVRFAKVMTCLNMGCPLGMGIWEGVPLRQAVWLARPTENLRRVYYWGFHNDAPDQMFRSSLPIGRVLEDPFDLPPVILCYKLNGQWLDSARGGPVRIVVPEAYGFKSVKWLTHVVLSNLWHANDTYAEGNNDIDSPLKTFAATLHVPERPKANEPLPITGYAQVGISGLTRVQVCIHRRDHAWPPDDPYFDSAAWRDATILGPPKAWGGGLPGGQPPANTHGLDPQTSQPLRWPLRLAKAHWAILLPGVPPGDYTLRCRTLDERSVAQPRPRPFQKSGHAALEIIEISVGQKGPGHE